MIKLKNLFYILFVLSFSGQVRANSAQVEGITQFLIDRANDTYFYIFENKMKKSKRFSCYFPEVYSYVEDGDLKALIKSKDIWEETLTNDLKLLNIRAVSYGVNKTVNFNKVAIKATNDYADLLQFSKIKIEGAEYDLNFIPLSASPKVRNVINGFYTQFNEFRDELINFNKKLINYSDPCSNVKPTEEIFKANVNDLKSAYKGLELWIKHIQQYKNNITVDVRAIEAACKTDSSLKVCRIKNKVFSEYIPEIKKQLEKPVVKAVGYVLITAKYINNIQKRKTATGKVVEAFKVIKEEDLETNEKLKKIKYYALFIAQLADADSADSVAGILKEYTLPVTSFLSKREPRKTSFMITSYFGYAAGRIENKDKVTSSNTSGFYVPVGFEYNVGLTRGGAISVMLSPFDFGYPISLRMNGENTGVDLEDIVAPSISVAYGVKDYPMNIGVAYQKGKKTGLNTEQEERLMLFVAFDMPLFSF